MLKHLLLAALIVSTVSTAALAQRPGIELTLEANYLWTSRIDATFYQSDGTPVAGTFDIKNNPAYGFTVDVDVRPGTQLEFLYLIQSSTVETRRVSTGVWEDAYDVRVSYYQIGAVQGFKRGNVLPFTAVTLGASSFDPDRADTATQWKFAMTIGLGAKVYINERIGLRFHGRGLISFLDTGAGLWVGTGGISLGLTGWGIWQWDLGGGLVILL